MIQAIFFFVFSVGLLVHPFDSIYNSEVLLVAALISQLLPCVHCKGASTSLRHFRREVQVRAAQADDDVLLVDTNREFASQGTQGRNVSSLARQDFRQKRRELSKRLAQRETEPLIDPKHSLIMGWSPRAACTSAVTMFFWNQGLYGPEDQAEYPWVHTYRELLGDKIKASPVDMENPRYVKFKILRNPYCRAVSSWIHQMQTKFSGITDLQDLAASQWKHGFNTSAATFVDWLSMIHDVGVQHFDVHSLPQYSKLESNGSKYDFLLKIESPDFESMLQKINTLSHSTLKLPDLDVTPTIPVNGLDYGNVPYGQLHGAKHPSVQAFYKSEETIKLVQDIYQVDFESYGYSQHLLEGKRCLQSPP